MKMNTLSTFKKQTTNNSNLSHKLELPIYRIDEDKNSLSSSSLEEDYSLKKRSDAHTGKNNKKNQFSLDIGFNSQFLNVIILISI